MGDQRCRGHMIIIIMIMVTISFILDPLDWINNYGNNKCNTGPIGILENRTEVQKEGLQ